MASTAVMSPSIARAMSAMGGGDGIQTMQNLVNSTAGDYSSIYQSCIRLKKKLYDVPDMEPFLIDMDYEEQENPEESDIVTSLWNMLRRGHPLLVLYNTLQPRELLEVPPNTSESKVGKAATFKFLHACIRDLNMPPDGVFLITDLYGRDTTGFLKVIKVIDIIIQMLRDKNLLLNNMQQDNDNDEGKAFTHNHEHVINEIITSERNYVSHLDTLQQFKNVCSQNETTMTGDLVHEIFMNLNQLVDYQRRFLIRLEQQNVLDPQIQNWGQLFTQYASGFKIYEPFVANTARSTARIQENWDKIRTLPNIPVHLQGLVSADNRALCGFMLKPLQRVTKYPLFLDQLIKDKTYDESKKDDLREGKAAINVILDICNSAAARASRAEEVNDLIERVEDWKGHRWEKFGELIMSGQHTVLKDDVSKGNKERDEQYQIFLFEHILFCCKEINQNKTKVKLGVSKNIDNKSKKAKLQLKGRIFVQNVTNVNKFQDNKISPSKPYHLQIYWRGDPGIENFQICFATPAQRDDWFDKVYEQVKKWSRATGETHHSSGTSQTDFIFLNNANLQNPYSEPDEDQNDEDESARFSTGSTLVNQDYPGSRNGSTPSLRSRSTTGSSGPPLNANLPGRNVAPLRFPMDGILPLKVSTNFTMATAVATPDAHYGQSYFSPIGDSPTSLRSSQSGTITPMTGMSMSRQNFSMTARPGDNKHQTAPPGTYLDRRSQRVGDQAQYNAHMAAQQRSRSLSSPDIQNQSPGKRSVNGSMHDDVPVPPIPHHVLPAGRPMVNRSQTSSPADMATQPRPQHGMHAYSHDPYMRAESRQGMGSASTPHGIGQRLWSPGPGIDPSIPTQIKVRIAYASNYVTIVVPSNIKYQMLIDRIDAKMVKHSTCSISKGSAKLRWFDEGSYVSLKDEDDIQMVLDEWRDQQRVSTEQGRSPPDLELEWHEGQDIRRKIHG